MVACVEPLGTRVVLKLVVPRLLESWMNQTPRACRSAWGGYADYDINALVRLDHL